MGTIIEKIFPLKNGRFAKIRTAKASDAEAYLTLGKSIMSEEIYSLTQADELNLTIEEEQNWLKSSIEDGLHLIIVVKLDGKLIGQLDISNGHRKRNAHTGEFGMGVHKDFRSLEIGSFLLTALIEWAKNHPQIEKINLCVHQTNERAIATYKKQGFQIEGTRTKDLKYSNEVYIDTVLMGLHA